MTSEPPPLDPFTDPDDGIPKYVLPYETVPDEINPGPLATLAPAIACGEVDFKTAVLQTPLGVFPVLYLEFRDARHRPLTPIALIFDVTHMQHAKEQLVRAINDGIRKAKARGAT